MKKVLIGLLVLNSASAFASGVNAHCVQVENQKNNPWLIGDEEEGAEFNLSLGKNSFTTDISIYKGKVTGTFAEVATNGSSMFSTPGLTEFADQSDIGNTFISEELMNGNDGQLTFSLRQLGDSEGSWWLSQKFYCTVKN